MLNIVIIIKLLDATPLSIGIQSYDIISAYSSSYYYFELKGLLSFYLLNNYQRFLK